MLPSVEVAIADGRLGQVVASLGEQAIEDDLGIHLIGGGRGRRAPGDVGLVRPAVAERVARAGRLAAELEAGEAGRVADVPRVELVGGDADADGVLRLVGLAPVRKLADPWPWPQPSVSPLVRAVLCVRPWKQFEVVAGERERPEGLGQVDERPFLCGKPGRQMDAVGDVPEAHPDGRGHRPRRPPGRPGRGSPSTGVPTAAPRPRSMVRRFTLRRHSSSLLMT